MQKIVLIIQARMGSTRLPGKSMMPLCGKPLIIHVLERVGRCRSIDEVVLATSTNADNDVLATCVQEHGVSCFRGSENDLLERYYLAASKHEAEIVLRLPADNVCSEPQEFDRLVNYHLQSSNDFSSNICNFKGNRYPDGIGVEAIDFRALKLAHYENHAHQNREHVATNFYDYINDQLPEKTQFRVGTIRCPEDIARPDIVLDVNTPEDYETMRNLYMDLYPADSQFSIHDIIGWFDSKKVVKI